MRAPGMWSGDDGSFSSRVNATTCEVSVPTIPSFRSAAWAADAARPSATAMIGAKTLVIDESLLLFDHSLESPDPPGDCAHDNRAPAPTRSSRRLDFERA